MDKKKSILNISVSVIGRLVVLIANVLAIRFLIRICGAGGSGAAGEGALQAVLSGGC